MIMSLAGGSRLRQSLRENEIQSRWGLYVPDNQFFQALSRTPGQQSALAALQRHPKFASIWNWFVNFPGGNPIRLVVGTRDPRDFGGYALTDRVLVINPAAPEHASNPMELVDTIVHELIHATLDIDRLARNCHVLAPNQWPRPLPKEVNDLINDPQMKAFHLPYLADKSNFAGNPAASAYMRTNYGNGYSANSKYFIDINRPSQRLIAEIVRDVYAQTQVGRPSFTCTQVP